MEINGLISVIIPTYNRADLIGQTLDSISNQSYTNWECIVVDDGSTDNSVQLIGSYVKKDSRFKLFSRPANRPKGANACRNYGFENSKGEYINWFDSDDLMTSEKLLTQINALENCDDDVYMCVCQTMVFEENPNNILGLRKPRITSDKPLDDYITNQIKWLTQAPLIRRSFLRKHEITFDETLQQSQEWDFFIRMLAVSTNYLAIDNPMVLFRKHNNSISSGEKTTEKLMSNYTVAKKALLAHYSLQRATTVVLRNAVVSAYRELLTRRFFSNASRIRSDISSGKLGFGSKDIILANLAFASFRIFGVGYSLLKQRDANRK